MFKTEFILANVAFFVKLFLKKIQDDSVVLISIVRECLRVDGKTGQDQAILTYRDATNYLSPAIAPLKRETSTARRPRTFAVKTEARRGTGPRPTVKAAQFG